MERIQRSTVLNNLGGLYHAKNDYPAANTAFKRALEIYERLASINPQTYEPYVAVTLINMGLLYKALFEETQNKQYAENGLKSTLKCEGILKNCINTPTVQNYNRYVSFLLEYFNSIE